MIVGFDADGPDVFERQYEFAMSTAVPIFSLGALVAPETTPLYERVVREGRLIRGGPDVQAVPWSTNIEPRNMTALQLRGGLQRLCHALYAPAAFGERLLRFIESFGSARPDNNAAPLDPAAMRTVDGYAIQLALGVRRMGQEESRMWHRVWAAVSRRPVAAPFVTRMLFQYAQARYMFGQGSYWEPHLGDQLVAERAETKPLTMIRMGS